MTGLRRRWARLRRRGEDGSGGGISLMMLTSVFALLLVFGLVLDGGTKVGALDQADRIAMEAARAGAQAVTGSGSAVDTAAADAAVQNYLLTEGAIGTTTVEGNQVLVHVTLSRPTKVLSIVGIDQLTVSGDGHADVIFTRNGG